MISVRALENDFNSLDVQFDKTGQKQQITRADNAGSYRSQRE